MALLETDQAKPGRKFLELTFWLSQALIICAFILPEAPVTQSNLMPPALACLIGGLFFLILYFVAIAKYAKKFEKSRIVWGIGAMLFPPISVWYTYFSSHKFKSKVS